VEEKCRAYVEAVTWEKNPIRFLIIDLTLVSGVDLSAAEAFVRLHRLLEARRVRLVFCGQSATSDVAKALQAVDLWGGNAEVFATLNEVSFLLFATRLEKSHVDQLNQRHLNGRRMRTFDYGIVRQRRNKRMQQTPLSVSTLVFRVYHTA